MARYLVATLPDNPLVESILKFCLAHSLSNVCFVQDVVHGEELDQLRQMQFNPSYDSLEHKPELSTPVLLSTVKMETSPDAQPEQLTPPVKMESEELTPAPPTLALQTRVKTEQPEVEVYDVSDDEPSLPSASKKSTYETVGVKKWRKTTLSKNRAERQCQLCGDIPGSPYYVSQMKLEDHMSTHLDARLANRFVCLHPSCTFSSHLWSDKSKHKKECVTPGFKDSTRDNMTLLAEIRRVFHICFPHRTVPYANRVICDAGEGPLPRVEDFYCSSIAANCKSTCLPLRRDPADIYRCKCTQCQAVMREDSWSLLMQHVIHTHVDMNRYKCSGGHAIISDSARLKHAMHCGEIVQDLDDAQERIQNMVSICFPYATSIASVVTPAATLDDCSLHDPKTEPLECVAVSLHGCEKHEMVMN